MPTHVTDPEAVQELARRAVEEFGRIDVWVDDAAMGFFPPFLDVPLEDFRRIVAAGLLVAGPLAVRRLLRRAPASRSQPIYSQSAFVFCRFV